MDIFVDRNRSENTGTTGELTVPEIGFKCDTLELPWRNNRRGESCILPDTYKCWTWMSPTLKRLVLRLEDKHGRRDCLVHNANFAGDTSIDEDGDGKPDLVTQVHGCTAVGRGYGEIVRKDGVKQFGILNSIRTLTELISAIGEGHHTITYRWKPGCEPEDPSDHQQSS